MRARASREFAGPFVAVLLLFGCGCGGGSEIPEVPIAQTFEVATREVRAGRGFSLRLERIWLREHVPDPWPQEVTEALVLKELREERSEDGRRVRVVRHYRAHAFAAGPLTIGPVPFQTRSADGSTAHETTSEAVVVHVLPALPPGEAGPVEFPEGPLEEPSSLPWLLGALAVCGAGFLTFLGGRLRRRKAARIVPPAEPVEVTPPDLLERHLRALARVRAMPTADRDQVEARYRASGELLREYVHERFGARVRERTREELVRDLLARSNTSRHLDLLEETLRSCDLVKFARAHPPEMERERFLERVETYLRRTSEQGGDA